MNIKISIIAWLKTLFRGRCSVRHQGDNDRCRLPAGHDGSHFFWSVSLSPAEKWQYKSDKREEKFDGGWES